MDLAQKKETFHPAEDHTWLGKAHGFDEMDSITLDKALFSLVTFDDGFLPSGLALGKVTATSKFGPYDDTATDGRQVCAGFLGTTQEFSAATGDNINAPLYWHGEVIEANLPANNGLDAAGKTDLTHIKFV